MLRKRVHEPEKFCSRNARTINIFFFFPGEERLCWLGLKQDIYATKSPRPHSTPFDLWSAEIRVPVKIELILINADQGHSQLTGYHVSVCTGKHNQTLAHPSLLHVHANTSTAEKAPPTVSGAGIQPSKHPSKQVCIVIVLMPAAKHASKTVLAPMPHSRRPCKINLPWRGCGD